MKKILALLFVLLLVLSVTGCSKSAPAEESSAETAAQAATTETSPDVEGTTEAAATEAAGNQPIKVCMVCSGNLGDTGIFDMGNAALTKFASETGSDYKCIEGKEDPSLYYDMISTAASNYELVFVNPGYQFEGFFEEMTQAHPDVTFIYPDGVSSLDSKQIVSASFKENEGSYLAGILAAMMTTRTEIAGINADKTLGFIGAVDSATINNFYVGFCAGVASIDPEIKVINLYVGSHNDPAKAKEMAFSLYDQGCDVIYVPASASSNGAVEASAEKGFYTIDVDIPKTDLAPNNLLATMLKKVDVCFYDIAYQYYNKTMEGGAVYEWGLKEGWVDLAVTDTMKAFIPADILEAVQTAKDEIIAGKLEIPVGK